MPVEQEFRDLVGWIDEFASDSDLDETDWRCCKQLSESMAERLDDQSTESLDPFSSRYVKHIDAWQRDVAALVELSPQSHRGQQVVEETLVIEKHPDEQPGEPRGKKSEEHP